MRNIPFFTTEFGVASLTLKEIPYRRKAYVRIQSALDIDKLLEECCAFCRSAGAEHIYATGYEALKRYPLHTEIVEMRCARDVLYDTDACLFPVTEETLVQWTEIYNDRMKDVDNAAYLTAADAKNLHNNKNLYFVHRDSELLGIGVTDGEKVECIATVEKGTGKDVMLALCHGIFSETVSVEVASTNEKATALYRELGFVPVNRISTWYKII